MDTNLIPYISVDCVIFGFDFEQLNVLLIERSIEFENVTYRDLKFPGDLIGYTENVDDSAIRVLKELTGLENIYLEQFNTFGDVDRITRKERDIVWLNSINHPEKRVISIAYFSLVKIDREEIKQAKFAKNANWYPVSGITELAFDHKKILDKALEVLRNKLHTQPIGFELLPNKFTLSQLQKLYEVILGTTLDKRNFRKKVSAIPFIIPLNEKQKGVAHKPAQLYRFDQKKYIRSKYEKLYLV